MLGGQREDALLPGDACFGDSAAVRGASHSDTIGTKTMNENSNSPTNCARR